MSLALSVEPAVPPTMPHVLVTLDAVGGVWRYAMDLASGLARHGYRFTFAGFGPEPRPAQRAEAERIGRLLWFDAPLDWLARSDAEVAGIPTLIEGIVSDNDIDIVHLNLPSQAAGLKLDVPVLVVSHSCTVTWFAAVRGTDVPDDWLWQKRLNHSGMEAADLVIAPSKSHADMLRQSYGDIDGLTIVLNGSDASFSPTPKEPLVFAAGRWWDDGKNGAVLDTAAAQSDWPIVMAGATTGANGQHLPLTRARTLGELPHREVVDWMARAAIVASPSRYEPFGLAPLEAARAGAALVLADIPTYRELWDGAALFAAPDDPQAFAAAINRLAGAESLRSDFAQRALERSRRYTLDHQVSAMAALYRRLLQPQAARKA
jgi:glycosyltransferase involved in cell wall biosynthesis